MFYKTDPFYNRSRLNLHPRYRKSYPLPPEIVITHYVQVQPPLVCLGCAAHFELSQDVHLQAPGTLSVIWCDRLGSMLEPLDVVCAMNIHTITVGTGVCIYLITQPSARTMPNSISQLPCSRHSRAPVQVAPIRSRPKGLGKARCCFSLVTGT